MNTTQNSQQNPYHQPAPPRGQQPGGSPRRGSGTSSEEPTPPKPPKVGRPDGLAKNLKEAPQNVQWGVGAWLITALFQIGHALVQFTANIMDSRALHAEVKKQLEDGNGGLGIGQLAHLTGMSEEESISHVVTMTNITMTGWLIFVPLVCAWLAWRAGRGGNYSRMFLSVGSLYLGLSAVMVVFSSAPNSMNVLLALMAGVFTILSGVTAVLGLYFMTRPSNAEWLGMPSNKEFQEYRKELQKYEEEQKKLKDKKKAEKDGQRRNTRKNPDNQQNNQSNHPNTHHNNHQNNHRP
ncbi:MFS transporter [Corynebacterium sp. 320]|uniref:MFS transporter n=1 Tax=Corynebacterium zhongnanshanii TaxID=2768834 RepID=A0ABQ6VE75_9CORY|nr:MULTISPECIES: hypothetical protein [Corynebacterium]KAB1504412.1 MFS transporter [Corynebacterium sp. 320]KAB1552489.1 MFS transporter [Corynebacterium sp. 321]KAB1554296.1 MFS transporter [Corynebacterium sp. 319]KAB3522731.1 MFS transporter [Corynebacterium zhongnanshanii]KAB3528548.1 MFS transporter [Corynebacterium sp. 250]